MQGGYPWSVENFRYINWNRPNTLPIVPTFLCFGWRNFVQRHLASWKKIANSLKKYKFNGEIYSWKIPEQITSQSFRYHGGQLRTFFGNGPKPLFLKIICCEVCLAPWFVCNILREKRSPQESHLPWLKQRLQSVAKLFLRVSTKDLQCYHGRRKSYYFSILRSDK